MENEALTDERLSKEELEQGLEDAFPASDPPAAARPVHHEQPKKR